MQAGENLCSLKSRNNCIMRRKIFDIYKALRHFNVKADEVDEIANGFKYWLEHPVERWLPCNIVYFIGDKLYSLPYPLENLSYRCVGVEIDGLIYLTHYHENVGQNQVVTDTKEIEARFAQTFKAISQFKLRMPTKDEAKLLLEKTSCYNELSSLICNKSGKVWITPNPDHPEWTVATVKPFYGLPHKPSCHTKATLYLVTYPDEGQAFFGEVDEYATPTPETQEVYTKLRSIVKH